VKSCLLTLFATLAMGQAVIGTYVPDINGHGAPTPSTVVGADGTKTLVMKSINGRQVPLLRTESKVIREDANGKVTETITRIYDADGQLASTERAVSDAQKLPDGGSRVRDTTYRSDVNGEMKEAERSTTESSKQGSTTRTETVIERPTMNASFRPVEKRSTVTETSPSGMHQDQSVYRASDNGGFDLASREVKDQTKTGNQVVEKTALYEPRGNVSQLDLSRQSVATTTKSADGSEVSEVNLYGSGLAGTANSPGAPQQIYEQQIIHREKGPGGSVIESLSVRRPSISDPAQLGSLQKVSETVCQGKCTPGTP
jgi:hypothetical protein